MQQNGPSHAQYSMVQCRLSTAEYIRLLLHSTVKVGCKFNMIKAQQRLNHNADLAEDIMVHTAQQKADSAQVRFIFSAV